MKTSIDKNLLSYHKNYDDRLKRKKTGLDSLFHYIQDNHNISDTLFKKFYLMMSHDIRLTHDRGAYETLKFSGLDYISNDSLRTTISRTYTRLSTLQFFANSYNDETHSKISELEHQISNIKTFNLQGNKIYPEYEFKVDNIITNPNFLWIYNIQLSKYNRYIHRLEQMRSALKELKAQIEEELKK